MSEEEVKNSGNQRLIRTWEDVKKKCPWYFTLKGLISERPNMVPVGLGNSTAEYDTSILSGQRNSTPGPSNTGDDPLDSDELKESAEDQELEDDLDRFNKEATNASLPDTKTAIKGKKEGGKDQNVTIKKEGVAPGKRVRSQVDRIADTEIARFECKKVKLETEQHRLKTVENVASVKAREKTRRAVEIRQAELEVEKERMRMNHEYQLEMLKLGHVSSPSSQGSWSSTSFHGFQPYPGAQNPPTPFPSSQPYAVPQPSAPFKVPSLESFPLPASEHSGSDRHTPEPKSSSFDETSY